MVHAPARAPARARALLGTTKSEVQSRASARALTLYTSSATDEVVQAASAGARARATVATTSNHAIVNAVTSMNFVAFGAPIQVNGFR